MDSGSSNILRPDSTAEGANGNALPLVSVIIPTRNRADLIAETLESVVTQAYPEIEIFVIDDGSEDDTKQVVAKFPGTIYHWQPARGVSAARNLGYRLSSGDYIQFLDSDDLLERDKIQVHVGCLEAHPEIDVVYGDARYFTSASPNLRAYNLVDHPEIDSVPWIRNRWEEAGTTAMKLIRVNLMPVSCPLLRRQAASVIGPWNEEMDANEDWEFWIRSALKGHRFHFLEASGTMALIRTHSESATWKKESMSVHLFRLHLARQLRSPYAAENYRHARSSVSSEPALSRICYDWHFLCAARFDPTVMSRMARAGLTDLVAWLRRRFTNRKLGG